MKRREEKRSERREEKRRERREEKEEKRSENEDTTTFHLKKVAIDNSVN
jgi:hypothetical protein